MTGKPPLKKPVPDLKKRQISEKNCTFVLFA